MSLFLLLNTLYNCKDDYDRSTGSRGMQKLYENWHFCKVLTKNNYYAIILGTLQKSLHRPIEYLPLTAAEVNRQSKLRTCKHAHELNRSGRSNDNLLIRSLPAAAFLF